MAGVADEERVGWLTTGARESRLRKRQACHRRRPGCLGFPRSVPDIDVSLADVDAGAAETGAHLGVPWVVPLVGAVGEDAHAGREASD